MTLSYNELLARATDLERQLAESEAENNLLSHDMEEFERANGQLNARLLDTNECLDDLVIAWLDWATDLAVVNWTLAESNDGDLPQLVIDTIQQQMREWSDPTVSEKAAKLQQLEAENARLREENIVQARTFRMELNTVIAQVQALAKSLAMR